MTNTGDKVASLKTKATNLYYRVKQLRILAEETSPEFKSYLQPILELNSAYDHFNRVTAAELGLDYAETADKENYIKDNLEKAIGHLYRAFFDVADWLSMNIREAIQKELIPYSHKCIQTVIPNYYPEIYPAVDRASIEIAEFRNGKDVTRNTNDIIEKYTSVILDLYEKVNYVKSKQGALIECESKITSEDKKSRGKQFKDKLIITLIGVTVAGILSAIIAWLYRK